MSDNRLGMGAKKEDVVFPVPPALSSVPADYAALPPADSDPARQVFKDPYLFFHYAEVPK